MGLSWYHELDIALQHARTERNPVLLLFGANACPECEKLDTETFADPRVQQEISRRFVPLRLDLRADRAAVRRYNLFWTPTLYFLDEHGETRAELVGFLPPHELLPVLDYGEAQVLLRRGKFLRAIELLDRLVEFFPDSGIAPDALYWSANIEFLVTRDEAGSAGKRALLKERYPASLAARKV
jgi:TolA-binding protein